MQTCPASPSVPLQRAPIQAEATTGARVPASPNQDQIWPISRLLASYRLSGCALCRTELNAPALVRPLPQHLEKGLYRFPRVYGLLTEAHSFLHRMASRCRRRFGAYVVWMYPFPLQTAAGLVPPDIHIPACIDDMRNYAASHPWATILDLELYGDAWRAGAAWTLRSAGKPNMEAVP